MSFGMGSLLEPLSVAMHAKDRVGMPLSGATVLVLGAGAVGLLCAAVCKTEKAKVLIADINQDRIAFAVRHGFADAAVLVPMVRPETVGQKLEFAKSVAEAIRTAGVNGCEAGEPHISFECTGVEACLQTAIYVSVSSYFDTVAEQLIADASAKATRSGGKVMLIGMGNPTQTLPISAASLREIDLVGVFRYADTYPKSIQLVSEKPPLLPDLDTLITHRYDGMGQIQSAFDMAARLKDDDGNLVLKVVVQMKE
jgi:L-iditol 2-dehydrogenase